jgi:hypothetical protein
MNLTPNNLRGWLEQAMCDMADGDISGAEDMLEDVDSICDLIGDQIHDACKGDWIKMAEFAEEARKSAYAGGNYYKALTRQSIKWRKWAKEKEKKNKTGSKRTLARMEAKC